MLALSTTFEQLTCPIPAIAVLIGSRDLGTNSETILKKPFQLNYWLKTQTMSLRVSY